MTLPRAALLALSAAAALAGLLWAGTYLRPGRRLAPHLTIEPRLILADGRDFATLRVDGDPQARPFITLSGDADGASISDLSFSAGAWTAQVHGGIVPGRVRARVAFRGGPPGSAELHVQPDFQDSAEDGTPDALRLDDEHDREAFRRWFAYLAEAQFFLPPAARPPEIVDCAALIRYAYREALRRHDGAWANQAGLDLVPAFDSIGKYRYPLTPLGAALFRVKPGPFREGDPQSGAFLQFADAQNLWRFNTHRVAGGLERALPGDLLFFRQSGEHATFHSMIYLGESQIGRDGRRYVVYHTGPEGSDAGQIKRPSVEELMRFPRVEWRPLDSNPSFLGVVRWNILRRGMESQ